ncbi:MAG: DUF5985 family protein [Terracidiphilus sp.]
MSTALYILTFFTTLLCAVLLLRAWSQVRRRLLLWSGLCFVGLAVTNALKFADLFLLASTDLYTWRLVVTALTLALLLYGLIWESR